MPRQTEPNANNAMGSLLQAMLPRSTVRWENTQTIVGHPGLQPDILVTALGRAPVVLEAEYLPATTVEQDALGRLGLEVTAAGSRPIEAVIALRYPDDVAEADDLRAALQSAHLSYCVFTEGKTAPVRFPESGWLEGSAEDVADMVRLVSVPQRAVEQATDTLQAGIERAAGVLDEISRMRPGVTKAIADSLGMTDVPQTRRMACAIIVNALVFHERITGMHSGIDSLAKIYGGAGGIQAKVVAAWRDILKINYWSIFGIAKDMLEQLDSNSALRVLGELRYSVQSFSETGMDNAHDLTGRIFQRLIADRKYLATFYTLPASAALLARLAVAKMEGVDWSDAEAVGRLRIADFACGTGALLSAVYEQIAARHERAGGDGAALHRLMMEEVLYGCDVMPSAVHITGSTLSGAEPSAVFENAQLHPIPYGRQADGSVAIGSLELLHSSSVRTLANMSDPAKRAGSADEETGAQVIAEFPDEGYDLVIMNPPFTSNTKHRDSKDGVLNAAFAAFESSEDDQKAMSSRMKRLVGDTCYHGHAGLASAFAALGSKSF